MTLMLCCSGRGRESRSAGRSAGAVAFVRDFFEQHKPVAAICHGPWTLIDAGVVHGRRLTSFKSIEARPGERRGRVVR